MERELKKESIKGQLNMLEEKKFYYFELRELDLWK